jgi:hypothetical protein
MISPAWVTARYRNCGIGPVRAAVMSTTSKNRQRPMSSGCSIIQNQRPVVDILLIDCDNAYGPR